MFKVNDYVGYKRFDGDDEISIAKVVTIDENLIGIRVYKGEHYIEKSEDVVVTISESTHKKIFLVAPFIIEAKKEKIRELIKKDLSESKKNFKKLKAFFTKAEKAAIKAELVDAFAAKITKLSSDKTAIEAEEVE